MGFGHIYEDGREILGPPSEIVFQTFLMFTTNTCNKLLSRCRVSAPTLAIMLMRHRVLFTISYQRMFEGVTEKHVA